MFARRKVALLEKPAPGHDLAARTWKGTSPVFRSLYGPKWPQIYVDRECLQSLCYLRLHWLCIMFALNEFFLGLFYLPCISRHPYLLVNCTSRKTNRKFVSGKLAIKFAGSLTVAHSTSMLTPPWRSSEISQNALSFFFDRNSILFRRTRVSGSGWLLKCTSSFRQYFCSRAWKSHMK